MSHKKIGVSMAEKAQRRQQFAFSLHMHVCSLLRAMQRGSRYHFESI